MKKIKIHIKSADITEERYKELTAVPFKKRPLSKEEKAKHSKHTIVNILTCVGMLLASNVSAGIGLFVGKDLDIELLAIFFYGITLYLIYLGFKGIYVKLKEYFEFLFKDTRNRTSVGAINSFFCDVLIDVFKEDFDEKLVSNSYDAFLGMTPELITVDYEKFDDYLKKFRYMIQQFAENGYKEVFETTTLPDSYRSESEFNIAKEEKRATYTHMSKTNGIVKFFELKTNERSIFHERLYYAEIDITLELLLIKVGKFWFVTDPMPSYTVTEEDPTVEIKAAT